MEPAAAGSRCRPDGCHCRVDRRLPIGHHMGDGPLEQSGDPLKYGLIQPPGSAGHHGEERRQYIAVFFHEDNKELLE